MKKRHYISLLILLAGLTVSAGFFLFPRQLPPERCSVVYREYKDAKDIRATFIHDFQVNDTLCLDVTLLEATSTDAWDSLMRFFALSQEMIDLYHTEYSNWNNEHSHSNIYFSIDEEDPKKRPTPDEFYTSPCVVASIEKQTFSIYHIRSKEQHMAVQKAEIKNINKHKQLP